MFFFLVVFVFCSMNTSTGNSPRKPPLHLLLPRQRGVIFPIAYKVSQIVKLIPETDTAVRMHGADPVQILPQATKPAANRGVDELNVHSVFGREIVLDLVEHPLLICAGPPIPNQVPVLVELDCSVARFHVEKSAIWKVP